MKREPERRRPLGLGEQEWRTAEVVVTFGACPDRRQRHHVGEIECRDRRLTDIGVDVGKLPSQASTAFTLSVIQVKSRPWITFSTSRSFSSAARASSSQT